MPSTPNKRPPAHVGNDTPRSPQATARQLHLSGLYADMRVRIVLVEGRRIAQQN